MSMPSTQEQLIYFLSHNIKLGSYDKKFITNMLTLSANKNITTNQSELLNRITIRYQRQLVRHGLDANKLILLPWTNEPIKSLPQYSEAHVSISGDTVILNSPYKREFVRKLTESGYGLWDKATKVWTFQYSERLLRDVIELVTKYYPTVNYCNTITNMLSIVDTFKDVKYWEPTLVQSKYGYLYIAAANESLLNAISHLTLATTPDIIALLTYYGVKTDPQLLQECNDELDVMLFAATPEVKLDMTEIDIIIQNLKAIKTDLVIIDDYFTVHKESVRTLCDAIQRCNIKTLVGVSGSFEDKIPKSTSLSVYITHGTGVQVHSANMNIGFRPGKHIQLVDNRKIDIK
jgi:hypothetical protein